MNCENKKIIFITGASGAGKTALVDSVSHELNHLSVAFFHFDAIGVPTENDMIKNYGSGREWQKAMTQRWAHMLVEQYNDKKILIIEGQVDLKFIVGAFESVNFSNYEIVLVHCESTQRHQRLANARNQPELINDTMDNWAAYLYKQAIDMNVAMLNTTYMNINEIVIWFKEKFLPGYDDE